jgi:hypothetical protein
MLGKSRTVEGKTIKRIDLFGLAVMAFGRNKLILKSKRGRSHLTISFTETGLDAHITYERKRKSHVPLVRTTWQDLQKRLDSSMPIALSEAEIDPAAPTLKDWIALVPRNTSHTSPLASRMLSEKGRKVALSLAPLLNSPERVFHEAYDTVPFPRLKGQSFKWALAYPTREMKSRTQRYLFEHQGRYFMISTRRLRSIFREAFGLPDERGKTRHGQKSLERAP